MDTQQVILVVFLTVLAITLLRLLVVFLIGGFSFARLFPAMRAFFRVLRDPETAARVGAVLYPPPPEPPRPAKLSPEPVRLLTVLQREGRLLDFLLEDISGATDEQVGAGVRELHRKAQAAVKEHLTLQPVMSQNEGGTVEVPAGFDPAAIQVTGNVTGSPPYRGTLRHHGWRVAAYKLPPVPEGRDELVIAPAEVEIA